MQQHENTIHSIASLTVVSSKYKAAQIVVAGWETILPS